VCSPDFAAVGDPEVESWRIELERGRRLDLDTPPIDLLWVLLGPETYLKLMGHALRPGVGQPACIRVA
jgi:hypothetical protein